METILYKETDTASLFEGWNLEEPLRIGEINFDTATSYILKTIYHKHLSQYLCHKEAIMQIPTRATVLVMALDDILIICKNYTNSIDLTSLKEDDVKLHTIDYLQIYSINFEFSEKKNNLSLQILKNNQFIEFDRISINFKLQRDVILLYHFIQRQSKRMWQKFFEIKLPIPIPHIYQSHFFLKKINSRGSEQKRVIVMSDKFIFNTEYEINAQLQYVLHETKWAHAIESFTSIKINPKSKTLNTLKIMINTTINKKIVNENSLKLKNKSSCELIFYTEENFKEFIFQCRRLYDLHKKEILEITNK